MKANDFDSIFEKTFHELTDMERAEMKELFTTEDEFNQLKFVMQSVNATIVQQKQNSEPSAELKDRLDHLYTQTYRNKGILWYNSVGTFFLSREKKWHQQNLLRIAALFLVFFTVYPFWNSRQLTDEKVQLSKNETVTEESAAPQKTKESDPQTELSQPSPEEDTEILTATLSDEAFFPAAINEEKPAAAGSKDDDLSTGSAFTFNGSVKALEIVASSEDMSFEHPDGIFLNDAGLKVKNSEFSAARHSDVLDILTATY